MKPTIYSKIFRRLDEWIPTNRSTGKPKPEEKTKYIIEMWWDMFYSKRRFKEGQEKEMNEFFDDLLKNYTDKYTLVVDEL